MPWKEQTVKELREEFTQAAEECRNFSALCREFGISRPTGYKWVRRARDGAELADGSHKPRHVPRRTPPETEQLILDVRAENPGWGGKTIRQVLLDQGRAPLPCAKTCCNILKRCGCVAPEESVKHTPYTRFEMDKPNKLWQTDFKGDYALGDGSRCFPLDIIDDCSRFCLTIDAKPNTLGVMDSFRRVFKAYGMPDAILSDNGAQFAGFKNGYTQFEKWLMEHDVLPIHGRIKHPQTQGKIERFHRTMDTELLKHTQPANLAEADALLREWREKYNTVRPHSALGMKTPASVYSASQRKYSETVPTYTYGGQYHVVKVNSWGYVRFDRWQVYLSETMIGEHVEFRPTPDGAAFNVCFRNYRIASFSTDSGQRLDRHIYRL